MGRLLFAESVSRYQGSIMRKIPHSSKFGRIFRGAGEFKVPDSKFKEDVGWALPTKMAGLQRNRHLDTASDFFLR
jgi:hypothetical protein